MKQNEVLFDRPPTTGPVGLPLRTSNSATAPRCQWLCVGWNTKVPVTVSETTLWQALTCLGCIPHR